MDAKQAKLRQMCSNPIIGHTETGHDLSIAPQPNQGFDPFRPEKINANQRQSNTFRSQVIQPDWQSSAGFDPRMPAEGSVNVRAQQIEPPNRAHAVTYEKIKDKGTVSNVVFEMDGMKWGEQPPERSKLRRVPDVRQVVNCQCPKDHHQALLWGDENVQLRPDRYLNQKPEFQPKYDREDPRVRAYEHLHGVSINPEDFAGKSPDKMMAADHNWANYSVRERDMTKHFEQFQDAKDRKQKELLSAGFGQTEREEFTNIPHKVEKSLWGTTAGWTDSNTELKKRNNVDEQIDTKEKKFNQLESSVFDQQSQRPRTAHLSLHRQNETVNNLNSEKRRINHMYSDINGRELGIKKIDLDTKRSKATPGSDFSSVSDWKDAQSEIMRRKTAQYTGPVAKNTSQAMSHILPLSNYQGGSVDSKSFGYHARKNDSEANDIHLGDNYADSQPKIIKQLQLKSNLHRPDFYGDQSGRLDSPIEAESQDVYEFDVGKLPVDTFDADLAKMLPGSHVVKCEVEYDKIMGRCNGKGHLLLRGSPSKISKAKEALEERGLEVKEHMRKELGKKSNFAELNNVDWMHPQLQREQRRLQNPDLRTHDYMLAQDLYQSSADVFGTGAGRHVQEWKKKLTETRALKNQTKAEEWVTTDNQLENERNDVDVEYGEEEHPQLQGCLQREFENECADDQDDPSFFEMILAHK